MIGNISQSFVLLPLNVLCIMPAVTIFYSNILALFIQCLVWTMDSGKNYVILVPDQASQIVYLHVVIMHCLKLGNMTAMDA